jgi:hypothetical protein
VNCKREDVEGDSRQAGKGGVEVRCEAGRPSQEKLRSSEWLFDIMSGTFEASLE